MEQEILRQVSRSRKTFEPIGGLMLENISQSNTEMQNSGDFNGLLIVDEGFTSPKMIETHDSLQSELNDDQNGEV